MPQPSVPQTVATEDDLGLPPLQSVPIDLCALPQLPQPSPPSPPSPASTGYSGSPRTHGRYALASSLKLPKHERTHERSTRTTHNTHHARTHARARRPLTGPRAITTSTPPQPPPARPTVLPDDARDDLDIDTYLHRESLRDPSLRCLPPKSLKRSRPGHAGRRRAPRYADGINLEPEDLGLLDEPTIFTSSATGTSSPMLSRTPFPSPR